MPGKDAARIALAGALVIGTVMLVLAVRSGRARGTDVPAASEVDDARRLLLVVNEHASGVEDPERTTDELVARLQELSTNVDAVITSTEDDLFAALGAAAAADRRVVLVGGDGSLHDATNAPLGRLPELALVPAGRANNITRGLGIPVRRDDALVVAARAPSRPVDALHVQTPHRSVYAIEAVSGGFQAAARDGYVGCNSGDLRQGIGLLVRAESAGTRRTRCGFGSTMAS